MTRRRAKQKATQAGRTNGATNGTATEPTTNRMFGDDPSIRMDGDALAVNTFIRTGIQKLFDPRRDIDFEAGYPKTIRLEEYRELYEREGIANRVTRLFPEESWAMDPIVHETEDSDITAFEQAFEELQTNIKLWHYLQRIDKLSGIGHFGVLLLGLADGKKLSEPAEGLDEFGNRVGTPAHELRFLRVFDESLVDINTVVQDESNPRFCQPLSYNIEFADPRGTQITGKGRPTKKVHWSRVIHIADNRDVSEIFGVPRMRPVFNRILDLRKLLGGSAEMFWKGAFPGLSFEVNPELGDVKVDTKSIKEQVELYMNGLQRFLTTTGVSIKSLSPQVESPLDHIRAQMEQISVTLKIPMRILLGTEAAKLASTQDQKTWNARVASNQNSYETPFVIRPTIDRFIDLGILPEPASYSVTWPDLLTATDIEKAEVADKLTTAMVKYVQGDGASLIPPMEYLTGIFGLGNEQAAAILEAAMERIRIGTGEDDE